MWTCALRRHNTSKESGWPKGSSHLGRFKSLSCGMDLACRKLQALKRCSHIPRFTSELLQAGPGSVSMGSWQCLVAWRPFRYFFYFLSVRGGGAQAGGWEGLFLLNIEEGGVI